jgi:hypothetical protein
MTNVSVAWVNIAGSAPLAASSAATDMPVTLLQQEDVSRNYRSSAVTSVAIIASYAANQSFDSVALLNTNLTAAGIVRIRTFATLSDANSATGALYDSNPGGSTAGQVDPNYKSAIVLASSVQTGWKALRIDLVDLSLTYLEAGFLFIGTRTQFTYNYDYGATRTVVDPSEHKTTRGGQTKIIAKPKFRRWDFNIGTMTETQRWSVAEAIDLANGISSPILFFMDPSSTNLGRDTIFGLLQESSPVASIQGFGSDGNPMYSRPYKIDERL